MKNVYRVNFNNGNSCAIMASNGVEALDTVRTCFVGVVSLRREFNDGRVGRELINSMRDKVNARLMIEKTTFIL